MIGLLLSILGVVILGMGPLHFLRPFELGTTFLSRCALCMPLGLLVQGVIFCLLRLLGVIELFQWACWAAAGFVIARFSLKPLVFGRPSLWEMWGIGAALLGAVTIGAFWINHPYGNMDAYSFWLLKARFLAFGGESWSSLYSAAFLNSDYPILYPCTVASLWMRLGNDDLWAVVGVQIAFYFGILALVHEAVLAQVGQRLAIAALVLMSSNVLFLYRASCLYAELPLMFLYALVAALSAKRLSPRGVWIVGLCCGLSLFVKQEGLVFSALCGVGLLLAGPSPRRKVAWFMLGLLPGLLLNGYCNSRYVSVAPLLDPRGSSLWEHLLSPTRYLLVLGSLLEAFVNLRWWGLTGVVPLVLLVLGRFRHGSVSWPPLWLGLGYASLMTAYFIVTPLPIEYHLRTAHERLLLQAWPMLVMAGFCSLRLSGGSRLDAAGTGLQVRNEPGCLNQQT